MKTLLTELRYEMKFPVNELNFNQVQLLVHLHPSNFIEEYPARYVSNVYLDSYDRKSYFENMDGLGNRSKVRIRWYGAIDDIVNEAFLEVKNKVGLVGSKRRFSLIPFPVNRLLNKETYAEVLSESKLPAQVLHQLMPLEVALLNRYKRNYYRSVDRRFRLTIDSEILVGKPQSGFMNLAQWYELSPKQVVELKYPPELHQIAAGITIHFPFRLQKYSKYVQGIEKLKL